MKREDLAGPALITAAVLIVLHQIAFGGRVSSQHPDVLGFWLPTYCFLGESLAAGHIPAWNPHVMAGVPFAADPQSGWMYLPAMALFTALPCHVAIRWMIVLQPIIGGLGLYAFLRSEGLSRPAATLGGLGLALPLASSRLGQFLPFPSSLAWSAVVLAACSSYFKQRTWARRLIWLGIVAMAWGQLAAAYLSHGLVIGTGAVVAYVAARFWAHRRDEQERRQLRVAALLLVPAALALNLAFLLPRLAYLPRSSFAVAEEALTRPLGVPPVWPLKLAVTPGAYLGAALLILVLLAFRSRRRAHLVVAFSAYALVFFIAGLDVVARNVGPFIDGLPVLGLYAHFPGRLGLALLLAVPILGALGLEAWRENGRGRDLAWAGLAVVAVWVAVPLALGVRAPAFALLAMGAAVAVPSLLMVLRRPGLLAIIPAIAALELAVNGVGGLFEHDFLGSRFQALQEARSPDPLGAVEAGWLVPLRTADVDPVRYEAAGTIARALQQSGDGRYASLAPEVASGRGYLTALAPADWPLLASQRSMLFGLNDVQGYNPVQLGRYWAFVRAVSPVRLEYNAAVFPRPPPVAFDLLQIGFVVQPADEPRISGLEHATGEGRWGLFEVSGTRPRASAIASWSVLSDPRGALSSVTASGFDSSRQVVLENDPGLGRSPRPTSRPPGTASYRQHDAQSATVTVQTSYPAIVLVRTPHDPNWRARVDGRPAPLLAANYLVQGIPVPPGRHRIELTYDDPWIGYGLFGSGMALAIFLVLAVALRNRPLLSGHLTGARSER
ncbi:MAG TPA: YfhO family protein [Actinomycetota bacterium]|nr:YfhO family protein [Actinomycetota bacterium]